MEITFDPAKNEQNVAFRGISFDSVVRFDWDTALVGRDDRVNYGEDRFIALGQIDGRLHVLVFTPRDGAIRVISLRKANKREIKRYDAA